MAQLTQDSTRDIFELLYKQAAATERIENLLGSNSLNNNKGLVAQVQEHAIEIQDLKVFKTAITTDKAVTEKRQNRNLIIWTIVFAAIQIIVAIVAIKH